MVAPDRSATGNTLAVMGPQLGYYYPEIVQQMDLHGPGINAQGAAVPGLAMYILIGRTQNYAWSLTSAGHDVRDVFAERLCEPDGGTPTSASTHYLLPRPVHARSRRSTPAPGRQGAHLPDLGARHLDRDRDGRRPAVRAHAQALDVRA